MPQDSQVTGNAGLYYACYRLSLLGWNVMPTARNARGVDILAYSQDATRFLAIQVKALSRRNPVPIGSSMGKVMGHFWLIVRLDPKVPSVFILKPEEVRELAQRHEKAGHPSFWLAPPAYEQERFKEKWDRIGRGSPS